MSSKNGRILFISCRKCSVRSWFYLAVTNNWYEATIVIAVAYTGEKPSYEVSVEVWTVFDCTIQSNTVRASKRAFKTILDSDHTSIGVWC